MVDDIEWNVINEGQLLDAMVGHKPVGVNKYFQMAFICDKFCDSLHKDVNPQSIWDHLETMYNLEALDESESFPFPNNEKEFSLPQSEFGFYFNKKDVDKSIHRESPKLPKKEPIPKTNSGRRDSTASNNSTSKTPIAKKELKKEPEKNSKQLVKNRNSLPITKEEKSKVKVEDKPTKRPTRGSLKPSDDSGSSGKSSPVNSTNIKRRRI